MTPYNVVYKFQVVGESMSSRIVDTFEAADAIRLQLLEEGWKDPHVVQLSVCEPVLGCEQEQEHGHDEPCRAG